MKPENITKLIKEWKRGVKLLNKDTKALAMGKAYYSAAATHEEATTLTNCISELEHAIKQ